MADPTTTSGAVIQATNPPVAGSYVPSGGPRPWDLALSQYQQLVASNEIGRLQEETRAAGTALNTELAKGNAADPAFVSAAVRRVNDAQNNENNYFERMADLANNIGVLQQNFAKLNPQALTPVDRAQMEQFSQQAAYYGAQAAARRAQTDAEQQQAAYDQAVRGQLPPEQQAAAQKAAQDAAQRAANQKNALDGVTLQFQTALRASGIDLEKERLGVAQAGANVEQTGATTAGIQETTAGQALQNQYYPQVTEQAVAESQARTAQQLEQTRQLSAGELNTRIGQLEAAIAAGMPRAEADRLMRDYTSGSTAFQRQTQRETQISQARDAALRSGMAVGPDQQYLPSAEPGGAYSQAFGALGLPGFQGVRLHPQPLTQSVQAEGIQTTEPAAPQYFDPSGHFTGGGPALGTGAPPSPTTHVPVQDIGPDDPFWQQPQAQPVQAMGAPAVYDAGSAYYQLHPEDAAHPVAQASGGTTRVPRALAWQGLGQRRVVRKPAVFAAPTLPRRQPLFAQ